MKELPLSVTMLSLVTLYVVFGGVFGGIMESTAKSCTFMSALAVCSIAAMVSLTYLRKLELKNGIYEETAHRAKRRKKST